MAMNDVEKAAIGIVAALAEAIQALKQVPSGELYAVVQEKLNIGTYNMAIEVLVKTGMVKRSNHLLTWVGPAEGKTFIQDMADQRSRPNEPADPKDW